jgi:hypothetical protein
MRTTCHAPLTVRGMVLLIIFGDIFTILPVYRLFNVENKDN